MRSSAPLNEAASSRSSAGSASVCSRWRRFATLTAAASCDSRSSGASPKRATARLSISVRTVAVAISAASVQPKRRSIRCVRSHELATISLSVGRAPLPATVTVFVITS
ncbi:hypothetical protein FEP65_06371 [Burkholderia multivorans]|nr:hypothetical protein [Burkholderia multivorans]